jgi:hypothetical protein
LSISFSSVILARLVGRPWVCIGWTLMTYFRL